MRSNISRTAAGSRSLKPVYPRRTPHDEPSTKPPAHRGVRPGEYGRGCWTAIQAVKPVIRWRIAGFELAKVVIRRRIARGAQGSAGESRWSRGDPPANRKQPPGGRSDPLPDRRDALAHP